MPIDLAESGETPNDPGDVDSGPEDLLNSPAVYEMTPTFNGVLVKGEYSGAANAQLHLEFYRNSGSGDRPEYLGTRNFRLDGHGHADIFGLFQNTPFTSGDTVAAVARDEDGNTSEFSVSNVFESLARQIAYARIGQPVWAPGMHVTYGDLDLGYTVERVFDDQSTGFYALGLESDAYGPALVIRGTETEDKPWGMTMDLFADTDPGGVGYEQFLHNWPSVGGWLGRSRWTSRGTASAPRSHSGSPRRGRRSRRARG